MMYQFDISPDRRVPDSPIFDGLTHGGDPGKLAFAVKTLDGRPLRCDACAVGAELNRWP